MSKYAADLSSFELGDLVEVIPLEKRHRSESAWEVAVYDGQADFPRGYHWARSDLRGRISVPRVRIRKAVRCTCGDALGQHARGRGVCTVDGCRCASVLIQWTDADRNDVSSDLASVLALADEVEISGGQAARARLALCARALVSEIRLRASLMRRADEVMSGSQGLLPRAAQEAWADLRRETDRLPSRVHESQPQDLRDVASETRGGAGQ